eukprot:SAG31_NODE_6266_length_2095_cov_10.484970_3_plen_153_part_00
MADGSAGRRGGMAAWNADRIGCMARAARSNRKGPGSVPAHAGAVRARCGGARRGIRCWYLARYLPGIGAIIYTRTRSIINSISIILSSIRYSDLGTKFSNFLRSVVARRRRLRSGSIRCQQRKVDFGRPRHPLRPVHMGKIIDHTTQAKHMH